ncbi:MAG: prolyl oligopeptidase family serine peptidase [Planctomycetota bacterium]|jgi:dipeptidyl aminopeptidase/acylaminoacyl peptidase
MIRYLCAASVALVCVAGLSIEGQTSKRPLDHDVYDSWNSITSTRISNDGRWVMYTLEPGWGDSQVVLTDTVGATRHVIERGSGGAFAFDSRFAAVSIEPPMEEVRQAQIEKLKPDEMPRKQLALVELESGTITIVDDIKAHVMPEEGPSYVVMHAYKERPEEASEVGEESQEPEGEETPAAEEQLGGEAEQSRRHVRSPEPQTTPAHPTEPEPAPQMEPAPTPEEELAHEAGEDDEESEPKEPGTTLRVRDLATQEEFHLANVDSFAVSKNGRRIVASLSTEDQTGDGMVVISMEGDSFAPETTTIFEGAAHFSSLAASDDGQRAAFLSDRDTYDEDEPRYSLYAWDAGDDQARQIAASGNKAFEDDDWIISEHAVVSFSDSGARIVFGVAPPPIPEPEEKIPDNEEVRVDVWHYRDTDIQPFQLENLEDEQKRTYTAIAHLTKDDRVVQLGTTSYPEVRLGQTRDERFALGTSNEKYRRMASHDMQMYSDLHIIDTTTGKAKSVVTRERASGFGAPYRLSPGGSHAYWFNLELEHWITLNLRTGVRTIASADIPTSLTNELHDAPSLAGAYGAAGWTKDDEVFLVYDRYDVWAVDPDGFWGARNVTDAVGRQTSTQMRVVDLDPDEEAIDASDPLLLRAFNEQTKDSGFFRDAVHASDTPEELVFGPKRWQLIAPARDADRYIVTREDFQEFPDLLVTTPDFDEFSRLSDANPHQDEYLWGTAELVTWLSNDGQELQGIVYKPEGFDPDKKYPMMTYFYERNSDGLHNHIAPAPHRSIINHSFYASRGYVIFVPDIPYTIGYPGDSAMNAVMPGVLKMIETGYIDRERLGVQGHSWGGYQIAYMVTQTDLFRCAEAGAPVSNMTSAYGGIRWGSGLSRQFQYEKTQSRIGGTLWNAQQTYIENSPVFWADRVNTPLLIMHNDHDGAVPWEQGIELFMALRRLGKPVWMINYNDQPHWPNTWHTRKDWARRMQQYFDHFLMDAPAPVWLRNGVPAIKKGTTFGFEPTESDAPVDLPMEHAPE